MTLGAQLNGHFKLGNLPLGCRIPSLLDQRKESMRPETAADNQRANPVSDVKQPIDTFDGRHFFQENCRVESTFNHVNPSPLKYTEQQDSETRAGAESNKQFINFDCFRPAVASDRRAA